MTPAVSSFQLITYDRKVFREKFNRQPFLVGHSLSQHPLLELKSLVNLSRRLPQASVKYNLGMLAPCEDLEHAPENGLSVQQTIERIEECKSWMVLKLVEQDPEYRELLLQCLREIRHDSEPLDSGMCEEHAFIFITSPNSITPCHIDPEINFLLQVRGCKTMSIFDPMDREIVSEQELETFYTKEDLSVLKFREEFESRAFHADLRPGVGVHCPVTAPHWVKNGHEVSISFSITFRTPSTRRRSVVYQMNHQLRQAGMTPAPYGPSPIRDATKYMAMRGITACRKLFGGAKQAA